MLARLPAYVRARDVEGGGVLRALLTAVADELAILENDLEELYDGWFVETCAEWLLPYLADLVGLEELPGDLGPGTSRRALVANTIAYRRRKGTAAVLGRVAADVTGWPARAVEYHQRLVTSTALDYVRPDRPATASVRDPDPLRLAAQDAAAASSLLPGLDPLAHTVEVRRIGSRRGRYGLAAVGVHLHPLRVDEIGERGWADAGTSPSGRTVDPLGRAVPLFVPRSDDGTDPATPLDPHRLHALLESTRAGGSDPARLPVGVRVGDDPPLAPEALRVAGLEDLVTGTGAPPVQAVLDPVTGRLALHPDDGRVVAVRYSIASTAEVGAGPWDRSVVHSSVLATDRYDGHPEPVAQAAARAPTTSISQALATARPRSDETVVVSVGDNATHVGDVRVTVPHGGRVVIVAAARPLGSDSPGTYLPVGLRPHLRGDVIVTGGPGASVVLDGLLIEGRVVVAPGELGALTLAQTTVVGHVVVEAGSAGANGDLRVRGVRSALGDLALAPTVPSLAVTDTIVDGAATALGAHATLDGVTVRGSLAARSLEASSCLLDADLAVAHRQSGGLRFTWTRPDALTPRRFRCVPPQAGTDAPAPVYASTRPGAPDHLALASTCPDPIRLGGEDGAEMGVHHHLRRPLRRAAAVRALAPYLPVGRELGIFGSG
ncbi:hypothetical protein Acsp06_43820 [Actinomycetospora sp. NBRC 106375]|nr:hypothetical protein Acsp06_43820 [Actinomycetospora sp. NBRC 106375]